MGDVDELRQAVQALAAVVGGDRWLNADACAVFVGLRPNRKGEPNRRAFLDRIATLPGFPKPAQLGTERVWKRSEVDEWMTEQRRVNRAA